jgi:hypothetical protein
MEKFTTNLLANLYAELQEIASEPANNILQYEKSYFVAEQKIRQLKDFMKSIISKTSRKRYTSLRKSNPSLTARSSTLLSYIISKPINRLQLAAIRKNLTRRP